MLFKQTPQEALMAMGLDWLQPVRNILDIFKPRDFRQIWPDKNLIFLSYSFSWLRWRRAIRFLRPLPDHDGLDVVEGLHHWSILKLLAELDKRVYYRSSPVSAALYLNVMYEGICSMEASQLVSDSAKEHLQSALETRISNIYCILFPEDFSMDNPQPEKRVHLCLFSRFRSTTRFLPPGYDMHSKRNTDDLVLRTHQTSSGSKPRSFMGENYSISFWRNPLQPSEDSFPSLLAYVPARFLAAFRFNAEMICHRGHDVDDLSHHYVEYAEEFIKDEIMSDESPQGQAVPEQLLTLTPIALSIGAKVVTYVLTTTGCQTGRELEMLYLIIVMSVMTFSNFLCHLQAQYRAGLFQETFCFSMIMQNWAEETSWDQKLRTANTAAIRKFWGSSQPASAKRLVGGDRAHGPRT
jgi:hypothetical protein